MMDWKISLFCFVLGILVGQWSYDFAEWLAKRIVEKRIKKEKAPDG